MGSITDPSANFFHQELSTIIQQQLNNMIFYSPALTAIVAASSSHNSVETAPWGVSNHLHVRGGSFDVRNTTQKCVTFATTQEGKARVHVNSYQKDVFSTTSNEYEEVLAKYPSHQDLGATEAAKFNSIRSFAYSPALQSRRTRA